MGDEEEPLLIEYRAKDGQILLYDISTQILIPYGYNYADRVSTPKGPATVIGVRDTCLWFHIDGDPGASFWDDGKDFQSLRKNGICSIDQMQPMVIDLTEKNGVYKLKRISYQDKNLNVILQNENGPCPLISISNVLALRGDITINPSGDADTSRSIDIEVINVLLSELLSKRYADAPEETKKKMEKAIEQLPNLQKGMDVNFGFEQPDSFEKSDQSQLFDLLGVRLVHGWLVDPVDTETHAVIGSNTYNDLMNKLVALDQPPASSSSNSSANTSSPIPTHSTTSSSTSSQSSQSTSTTTLQTTANQTTANQTTTLQSTTVQQLSAVSLSSSPTRNNSSNNALSNNELSSSPNIQRNSSSLNNSATPNDENKEQKKPEEVKPPTAQDYHEGEVINSFLRQTGSQLTSYGLGILMKEINEDELCVFFRNNHFSTITKHDNQLYILVTDIGYEKERIIVWDLLNSVDGTSLFVTGDFKPTDDEKKDEIVNTLEIMGWEREKIIVCYEAAPRDKLVNADDAISYLAQMLGPQT